ncbi:hypothetical protein OFY17_08300 [Marinomonas sp. C2222]|uniref:Uncharacterized protein n=1 Tax=Marinomonas sargassi TaxID=2984494 RepID=A0ABT2YSK9_9GAMM|nr:hypothetical protein [Marinomonas sargassi]MCV2402878.1 hypothetical protein [Marinomonas sargassi]
MYGENDFSRDVVEKFGSDIAELGEESGMLHTQMGILADAIRCNIPCKNEILNFIESLLSKNDVILEIENAVAISFLELNELSDLKLQQNMPIKLHRLLKEQHFRWLNIQNT